MCITNYRHNIGSTDRSLDAADEQAGLYEYSHLINDACEMQDGCTKQTIMRALVFSRTSCQF